MTPSIRTSAPAVAPGESQSAKNADDDRGATHTGRVIPVGQEPPPLLELAADGVAGPDHARSGSAKNAGVGSGESKRRTDRARIRNPEGLRAYRNALQDVRVFRGETMRHLRRAEIAVWLAIHGCQGREGARITYTRLAEITGTSRKHVGKAIGSLKRRGLLEILETGRFRPGSNGESGSASRYRVYPSPEPRLVGKGPTAHEAES